MAAAFRPALLVVDFQEDFCPPDGAIPVPHARAITPYINTLLSLPFVLKIATRDTHPPNHISFAANHHHPSGSAGNNGDDDTDAALPENLFPSTTRIVHPSDPSRSYTTALWPVHCVAGTPGAQLVPEMHAARVHAVLDKGMDARLEMYSAFYDPFRITDSGLAGRLRAEGVTHVFVAGLAADYCVRATAEHAVEEGFRVFVVDEATRPAVVEAWAECRRGMTERGVEMVSVHGPEVAQVRRLALPMGEVKEDRE
ncbi:hypothetical protein E4U21_004508 [Claviceps maximensis]|nr:hypothetical protein E4U21_004508 [Claviceps maximensis]